MTVWFSHKSLEMLAGKDLGCYKQGLMGDIQSLGDQNADSSVAGASVTDTDQA